jgi:hypothetical protein
MGVISTLVESFLAFLTPGPFFPPPPPSAVSKDAIKTVFKFN